MYTLTFKSHGLEFSSVIDRNQTQFVLILKYTWELRIRLMSFLYLNFKPTDLNTNLCEHLILTFWQTKSKNNK